MAKKIGWELFKETKIAIKALKKFCPGMTKPKLCSNCGRCASEFQKKEREFFEKMAARACAFQLGDHQDAA